MLHSCRYLHEVRELYDREEDRGVMGRWGVLELPPECRDLQAHCFTSYLLKNSMPIPLYTDGITRWKIVRAYSKFSLQSWEEYLLVMENSERRRYLYRVVNVMESMSDRNVVTEMKQGGLVLVQEGEDDPMGVIYQYHRLLRQQEEYLTSTRYPVFFSICLVLMGNSDSTEMITPKLNELRQEFPELDVEFWNREKYPNFLLDTLSGYSSNNVVLFNHLNHLPHYDVVEKCYSHSRLNVPISLIPDRIRFKCVSVEKFVRVLRQHSDIHAPLFTN